MTLQHVRSADIGRCYICGQHGTVYEYRASWGRAFWCCEQHFEEIAARAQAAQRKE